MIASTLRLFKAVCVEAGDPSETPALESVRDTIPLGFVLDPRIKADRATVRAINDVVGISGEQANAAFHKSWEKVRSASIEQLVMEQLIHYVSTYGFRSIGIHDPSTIYIPLEKLELPETVKDDFELTRIRGLKPDELLDQIIKLGSGIALMDQSLDDIMAIVKELKFEPDFLDRIGNHELLARLYDFYGLVPEEPVAFLRFLVYAVTGSSLLIKNPALIELIKAAEAPQKSKLDGYLAKAPEELASIFYRFKPIFLALKSISSNKTFFNRLRKDAVNQHRPLPVDYFNSITSKIRGGTLDLTKLSNRLSNVSVFRKIRLAYALQYRLNAGNSIVYLVRNGRGWATDFDWPKELYSKTLDAFNVVYESLIQSIRPQVDGKVIFIPSLVNYSLPATEKQFAGPFPFGSYVANAQDTVFGIHWFNVGDRQIDLDLSLMSAEGKIGWDAAYRNEEVLFSGDITDAPRPNGATELFYVKKGTAPYLVMCNYYNFSPSTPVEARILVACDAPKKLKSNYMIDPSKIVAKAEIVIGKKQTVLGLVLTVEGQTRFYFGNVSVGCGISAALTGPAQHAREYLTDKFASSLDFKKVLHDAGGTVVSNRPDQVEFVDLSPENLTKQSILSLVQA